MCPKGTKGNKSSKSGTRRLLENRKDLALNKKEMLRKKGREIRYFIN
jgi:hypothetical protein